MNYKTQYRPIELLINQRWVPELDSLNPLA
jgi:arginyl-tRNA--protein-N-Asp/Glu arginylyltransferase